MIIIDNKEMDGLIISLNNSEISIKVLNLINDGGLNQFKCIVETTEQWNGVIPTIVFANEDNSVVKSEIVNNGVCIIPQSVLKKTSYINISARGIINDNTIYSTNQMKIPVFKGSLSDTESVPEPDIFEQYVQEVGSIAQEAKNSQNAIENMTVSAIEGSETNVIKTIIDGIVNLEFILRTVESGGGSGGTTIHNALSGRSSTDTHPIDSITDLRNYLTKLDNGYNSVDTKINDNTTILHDQIQEAYINTIAYPIIDQEYNANNTWITFDNKIYKCIKDTIWTGVITSDWVLEFMTIEETRVFVSNQIQAALSGEFPLQMRPDDTYGVYQNKEDLPMNNNEPGYLTVVINSPGNGIYIWGIDPAKTDIFTWIPFVVIEPINQDTISVTFNGITDTLKNTMISLKIYIDNHIKAETDARLNQYNGLNIRTTELENKALTVDNNINATVFRGTQEEYDTDPNKDTYFLALIVEE